MKLATTQLARCGPSCPHEIWTATRGAVCTKTDKQTWKDFVPGVPFPIWCPLPDAPEANHAE